MISLQSLKTSSISCLPLDLYNQGDTIEISVEETFIQEVYQLNEYRVPNEEKPPENEDLLNEIAESINETEKVLREADELVEEIRLYHSKDKEVITMMITPSLNLVKGQYQMILEILKLKDNDSNKMEEIKEKYSFLGERSLPLNSRNDICFNILTHCLNAVSLELLRGVKNEVGRIQDKHSKVRIKELNVLVARLQTLADVLPFAVTLNKHDLFARKKDDPHWDQLKESVEIQTIAPSTKITKSYKKFYRELAVGVSMISRSKNHKNVFVGKLSATFGLILDTLVIREPTNKTDYFYSQASPDVLFQVWNLLDKGAFIKLLKFVMPTIKHSRKIYLPTNQYDRLTFEVTQKALENQKLNNLEPLTLEKIASQSQNKPNPQKLTYKDLRTKNKDSIPLRVLSAKSLLLSKNHHVSLSNCFNGKKKNMEIDSYFDGVVLHIHGGGFVAMSSASHQTYTRQWARLVGKAVLSVDYSLAPEHPYPTGLNDCWQVYNWILDKMEGVLGIKPSKIILAGDSAGGNLCLALTFLIMKMGLRPPDGIMLAYPAMRVDTRMFSPSLILALHDLVLPHTVLKVVPQAYVPPEGKPDQDPMISPLCASDELLKKLPPIRVIVGDKDPLQDDCWRFVEKLQQLKKDVKMTVYHDLAHGFLGFDVAGRFNVVKKCINDSAEMIKELFSK